MCRAVGRGATFGGVDPKCVALPTSDITARSSASPGGGTFLVQKLVGGSLASTTFTVDAYNMGGAVLQAEIDYAVLYRDFHGVWWIDEIIKPPLECETGSEIPGGQTACTLSHSFVLRPAPRCLRSPPHTSSKLNDSIGVGGGAVPGRHHARPVRFGMRRLFRGDAVSRFGAFHHRRNVWKHGRARCRLHLLQRRHVGRPAQRRRFVHRRPCRRLAGGILGDRRRGAISNVYLTYDASAGDWVYWFDCYANRNTATARCDPFYMEIAFEGCTEITPIADGCCNDVPSVLTATVLNNSTCEDVRGEVFNITWNGANSRWEGSKSLACGDTLSLWMACDTGQTYNTVLTIDKGSGSPSSESALAGGRGDVRSV